MTIKTPGKSSFNGSCPELPVHEVAAEVARSLRLFIRPGDHFEVRLLKCGYAKLTLHGFYDYDHVDLASQAVAQAEGDYLPTGCYLTPNPLKINDKMDGKLNLRRLTEAGKDKATSAEDVDRRTFLQVDSDPIRAKGFEDDPATDEECERAWELIQVALGRLAEVGLRHPIQDFSGNGYHGTYPIDLPNDDTAKAQVKAVLHWLASECKVPGAKIDKKLSDACRIWKIPGTLSRRGKAHSDRPYRRASILWDTTPQPWSQETASANTEALLALAETIKPKRKTPSSPRPRPEQTARTTGKILYPARYLAKAVEDEAEAVRRAEEGNRNNQLNESAYTLGTLVTGLNLDRETAERALLSAATSAGLGEGEAMATIKSGITRGMENPRQVEASATEATEATGQDKAEANGQVEAEASAAELGNHEVGEQQPLAPSRIVESNSEDAACRGNQTDQLGTPGAKCEKPFLAEAGAEAEASENSQDEATAEASAPPPEAPAEESKGNRLPYKIERHRTYRRNWARDGESEPTELANFEACITEDVLHDLGGETDRVFNIEGVLWNGARLPALTIRAEQFPGMSWVVKHWGSQAIVRSGEGRKDQLREAIQMLSRPRHRTVYAHTGWREIDGKWYYLTAGGGIGANGLNQAIAVELGGRLAHCCLPPPPRDRELHRAIREVLSLLSIGPCRIMFPILCAVFRSVLGRTDFAVHLSGPTGAFKTELLALAQRFFGSHFKRLNLPGTWQSTAAALQALFHQAKDMLLAVDDFCPVGNKRDMDVLHKKADDVIRGSANGLSRQRANIDGSIRQERESRCLPFSSGEDIPRGTSLQARMFGLPVRGGINRDINSKLLAVAQREASKGTYALAMSAYVCWLAGQWGVVSGRLEDEVEELRTELGTMKAHPRAVTTISELLLGWRYFLCFAEASGAVDEKQRQALWKDAKAAVLSASEQQAAQAEELSPARQFLDLIASAIRSGQAHLSDDENNIPSDATLWGWRPATFQEYTATPGTPKMLPSPRWIGWIEEDSIYLEPEQSFAAAQTLAAAQGTTLPLTREALHGHLRDGSFLKSWNKDRCTIRKRFGNTNPRVLHLACATLFPPPPPRTPF